MPMLLTVVCKALLVKDDRILMLRLGPKGGSANLVGTFDLPGGRLRAGETFDEVLQRELWEECAFDYHIDEHHPASPIYVDDLRLPGAPGVGKTYEPAQAIRLFFKIPVKDDTVTLGYEHDDYVWLSPKDIGELVLFPGIGDVVKKIFPAD